MKNWISASFLIVLMSCQTVKIKTETYQTSPAAIDLGAIGHSKTFLFNKDFHSRVYPKLDNKIRVNVQVLPFNKKLNQKYIAAAKYNQSLNKIQYIDSLETKPEFVIISLSDINGYTTELNSVSNQEPFKFIKNAKKATVITSIALTVDADAMQKIKQADASYLINKQEKTYMLLLFKEGKQLATLNLNSANVFAYQIGYFCWAENKKGQWEIADINKSHSCSGDMHKHVEDKKKTNNLFKL